MYAKDMSYSQLLMGKFTSFSLLKQEIYTLRSIINKRNWKEKFWIHTIIKKG